MVPVSEIDPYDKISTPVVADRAGGIVFVSIARNKSGSPEETRGRIYTVNLPGKDSQLAWDQPHAVRVLDHDETSGRTLIRLLYRIENVTASQLPAFSPNQLYMAVPDRGSVAVIETATNTVCRSIATGSTVKPGVAFHPDGRRIAICWSNQYQGSHGRRADQPGHYDGRTRDASDQLAWMVPKVVRLSAVRSATILRVSCTPERPPSSSPGWSPRLSG